MKLLSFCLTALALVSFFPSRALACACCAEKGEYYISTEKPDSYKLGLLAEMKFDEAAEIYLTEAGFDGIKGLKSIAKDFDANDWTANPDFFNLDGIFAAKTWKMNFRTKSGKTGALVLPVPAQMLSFKADLHDTPADTEVAIYKEWRFKGTVRSGNGFLAASIVKPTTYFLVLQGRGNNCDNAEDFKYWRLEITGKNADYAFFGKLK